MGVCQDDALQEAVQGDLFCSTTPHLILHRKQSRILLLWAIKFWLIPHILLTWHPMTSSSFLGWRNYCFTDISRMTTGRFSRWNVSSTVKMQSSTTKNSTKSSIIWKNVSHWRLNMHPIKNKDQSRFPLTYRKNLSKNIKTIFKKHNINISNKIYIYIKMNRYFPWSRHNFRTTWPISFRFF